MSELAGLGPRLIVSSPGNEGESGGVFAVGEADCELLDPLPTTGMAVSPDASQLARLTWVKGQSEVSELVVNDASGLLVYRRLDTVHEPHSLMWRGNELLAVSTGSNGVVVLDDAGRHVRTWRPAGVASDGDRWHLNSLAVVEDRLLVSAFGIFDEVRGWSHTGSLDGAGVVFDLDTWEIVLAGLAAPHDPTWEGDGWLVCNSLSGEVLRLDRQGRRSASVHLGGWTRGLHIEGEVVYVGVSVHRRAAPSERARIAVLDRSTLREVGRMIMPSRDVFEILPYDDSLANGLRVGVNLGVARNLGSSAVVMDRPLHRAESVARVELLGAERSHVMVSVANRSSAVWSGFGTNPVRVGARWWDELTNTWVDISRTNLDSPLYPGREVEVRLELPSLPRTGRPLQISVLQEMVRWFVDVSPHAAIEVVFDDRAAEPGPPQ